jgi:RimJ/RimL family protein N-acetyltransferase
MSPIYLRALELSDLERTHRWHNNQEMYATMGSTFRFVSPATEEAWLRSLDTKSVDEVNLAICMTETSEHIGNIYLRHIDWIARHASAHIFIGEVGERSSGYGYVAAMLLVEHAFADLGLRRVYLLALAGNVSVRLAQKCGFVVEGVLRQHAFIQGMFKDVVVMGRFADEKPVSSSSSPLKDTQERMV